MALTKCVALFSLTTAPLTGGRTPRTAGWSESIYYNGVVEFAVRAAFDDLCNARAGLLTRGASIIGQRYQLVDPVGPAAVGTRTFPGTAGSPATSTDPTQDYPALCAYFRLPTALTGRTRPFFIRGLPDDFVRGGEWYGGSIGGGLTTGTTALANFLAIQNAYNFVHRYRTFSTAQAVFSIAEDGTAVTVDPHGWTVGQLVRAYRMRDTDDLPIVGNFRVASVINTYSVTLVPWGGEVVSESGQLRLVTYASTGILSPATLTIVPRIISRKPGRPFDSFRGRASRRRRSRR